MQVNANHYFRAGIERMRQARELYRTGESYALSMYISGLAVECVLRAFRWEKAQTFQGRHDLQKLFSESGFLDVNEDHLRSKGLKEDRILAEVALLHGLMDEVTRLWQNELRFAPESLVRSKMAKLRRHERKRGDLLKLSALELLTVAQRVVDRGEFLWTWSKR